MRMRVGACLAVAMVLLSVNLLAQEKPVDKPADPKLLQLQVDNLKDVIARLSAKLDRLETAVPKESEKQARTRSRKSWQLVCRSRGMAFSSLQVDQDGKSTVICR